MSWETLVVGYFSLQPVPDDLKQKILSDLETALETGFEFKEGYYRIYDVNWHSHVTEEKIDRAYQKWKCFFREFAVSLYWLSTPDHNIYHSSREMNVNQMIEGFIESLKENVEDGCYELANANLEGMVEILKNWKEVDAENIASALNSLGQKLIHLDMDVLSTLLGELERHGAGTRNLKAHLLSALVG